MLFLVEMHVKVPYGVDPARLEELKAEEKAVARDLQKRGMWRHLWRVVGQYANVSIFDVTSHDELHEILTSLPLWRFLEIRVVPLATHPSSIERKTDPP